MQNDRSLSQTFLALGKTLACLLKNGAENVWRLLVALWTILLILLRPARYLWPWILNAGILVGVLALPQGSTLAQQFSQQTTHSAAYVALSVALASGLTFSAVLLTVMAEILPGKVRSSLIVNGLWITGLTSAPGLFLGAATKSAIVVAVCSAFAAITLFLLAITLWKTRGQNLPWAAVINWLDMRRMRLAGALLFISLVPLGIGAQIAVSHPVVLEQIGTLLVLMVGLSALSTLFGLILVAIPAAMKRPGLGWIFALGMITLALSRPFELDAENPLLKKQRMAANAALREEEGEQGCASHSPDFATQVQTRVEHAFSQHEPIYFISAAGGGIRAAYWTGVGLAQLDVATNGKFAQQVASLSGVSGGSLGIATWLAANDVDQTTPEERLLLVKTFLSGDFLAPLVGGLLFLDVPRLAFGPFGLTQGAITSSNE
jgi:hypothetical protein